MGSEPLDSQAEGKRKTEHGLKGEDMQECDGLRCHDCWFNHAWHGCYCTRRKRVLYHLGLPSAFLISTASTFVVAAWIPDTIDHLIFLLLVFAWWAVSLRFLAKCAYRLRAGRWNGDWLA
jgi:hypothetical protein